MDKSHIFILFIHVFGKVKLKCVFIINHEHCYMIFHDFGVAIASANVVGGAS